MDKLKKNSKIKHTEVLSESKFFTSKDMISTDVPMINVALSGQLDGGLSPGLTTLAGKSKHFKTSFALKMAAAYLRKYPEAVMLFYDSEFGSPQDYFKSFGVPIDRVLHTPIKNIEELKFDLVSQLENLDRDDRVVVVIDSIGNLASKKEVEDALSEKSVADMTRAKQLKSLFRMTTPYLMMNNIPMIAINHTYDTQEMFSKAVVSGGTGVMYSSDNVWIIGRRQNKTGTEITGYDFVINVEKSRYVKEKSKIPITVSYDAGISKYSGIFDLGIALGYIVKSGARYQLVNLETGELDEKKIWGKDIPDSFYAELCENDRFKEQVKTEYMIGYKSTLSENFLDEIPVQEEVDNV